MFAEEHKNSLSRKSLHNTLPPPFQENNGPLLMTEANQKKAIVGKQSSTIIVWGFCDTRNSQGRGKCYQPSPEALADYTYQSIVLIEEANQPVMFLLWHSSWKSCIARATYRLFTHLLVD